MIASPAALHQPPTSSEEILARLFRPMGIDGVYGRTGAYEEVVDALGGFIGRLRPRTAEVFRFPPVVSRALIEKSGYLASFPHLLGCVCALGGDEARVEAAVDRFTPGGTWTDSLDASELVLAPAACYPIYAIAAARGPTPRKGSSSTSPAIASVASPHAISIGCNPSACANSSRSARRSISGISASSGSPRARNRRRARPLPPHRGRERSILRPRRRDGREVPGRAGAEIRNARADPIGGTADGLHEHSTIIAITSE